MGSNPSSFLKHSRLSSAPVSVPDAARSRARVATGHLLLGSISIISRHSAASRSSVSATSPGTGTGTGNVSISVPRNTVPDRPRPHPGSSARGLSREPPVIHPPALILRLGEERLLHELVLRVQHLLRQHTRPREKPVPVSISGDAVRQRKNRAPVMPRRIVAEVGLDLPRGERQLVRRRRAAAPRRTFGTPNSESYDRPSPRVSPPIESRARGRCPRLRRFPERIAPPRRCAARSNGGGATTGSSWDFWVFSVNASSSSSGGECPRRCRWSRWTWSRSSRSSEPPRRRQLPPRGRRWFPSGSQAVTTSGLISKRRAATAMEVGSCRRSTRRRMASS